MTLLTRALESSQRATGIRILVMYDDTVKWHFGVGSEDQKHNWGTGALSGMLLHTLRVKNSGAEWRD